MPAVQKALRTDLLAPLGCSRHVSMLRVRPHALRDLRAQGAPGRRKSAAPLRALQPGMCTDLSPSSASPRHLPLHALPSGLLRRVCPAHPPAGSRISARLSVVPARMRADLPAAPRSGGDPPVPALPAAIVPYLRATPPGKRWTYTDLLFPMQPTLRTFGAKATNQGTPPQTSAGQREKSFQARCRKRGRKATSAAGLIESRCILSSETIIGEIDGTAHPWRDLSSKATRVKTG
jgi:hypothetical protein